MRLPTPILLVICLVSAAQSAEQMELPEYPGVTNSKTFYPNQTLKLVNFRRAADGLMVAAWHFTTNGAIAQVDDFNPPGRLLRTLVKWQDGSRIEFWFDEQHRLWRESRFEPPLTAAIVWDTRVFLLRGDVILHPSQRWSGSRHKLNDSRDTVAFNVVSDASTNATASATAYDFIQATNRDAFVALSSTAKRSATASSSLRGWSIYIIGREHDPSQSEVRECFFSNANRFGLHVRLVIPGSLKLTKDQREYMEAEFKSFLENAEVRNEG